MFLNMFRNLGISFLSERKIFEVVIIYLIFTELYFTTYLYRIFCRVTPQFFGTKSHKISIERM